MRSERLIYSDDYNEIDKHLSKVRKVLRLIPKEKNVAALEALTALEREIDNWYFSLSKEGRK